MLGSTRVPKSAKKAPQKRPKPRFQPKKRPVQERSRATYESMLDAAARLLERHGYAALTTNHVAEAAGVAIGSLYEYFPTKDVIVAEVVRRTMADVAREVATGFQQALAQGFDVGLGRWVSACFAALGRRANLMRVLWMDVPFLWELEEVQALPLLMVGIARQGLPDATSPWLLADPEAATYLLTVMIRAAIVEGVVARPAHLSMAQVEASLTSLLSLVLLQHGTP
jgi:AcrR family transcriptional regulator